jgi:hypothetical protein
MNELVDFLKGFNVQQIISMVVIFWFMTKSFREDIKEIKIDIKDMDRRISHLEGAFTSKSCCILNHEQDKKGAA